MDLNARLEALQAENDRLKERVAELEAELGRDVPLPFCLRLTASEATVLGALMKRPMVSKEGVMMALYGDGRERPAEKIADQFICKLRKKLSPFGVAIETVWGQGYRLAAETKDAIASMREMAA